MSALKRYTILHLILAASFAEAKIDPVKNLELIMKHDQAVFVLETWMRDPYIVKGPDGHFYMTCTRINAIEGGVPGVPLWRSKDLAKWEKLPKLWSLDDSRWMKSITNGATDRNLQFHIWAPEIHFRDGRWLVMMTSSGRRANLLISEGEELKGPFTEPMGYDFGHRHDPSLFTDDDGTHWLLYGNRNVIQFNDDFSGFIGEPFQIGPSDRRIGHEGIYMIKVGGKYVLFGTGWSTDKMRHGSYNLYYCTADNIRGPFGPRKFAARFCGHGSPFQDNEGRWWTTAFLNGDDGVPLVDPKVDDRVTDPININGNGLTLVPLKIFIDDDGEVVVTSPDDRYAHPGPEEVQQFQK